VSLSFAKAEELNLTESTAKNASNAFIVAPILIAELGRTGVRVF
jgi:hypothetical protein